MAYVISSDCVSCGACEGACPVSAISQGDEHYEIDAGTCIDCGTCAYPGPPGVFFLGCGVFFVKKIGGRRRPRRCFSGCKAGGELVQ